MEALQRLIEANAEYVRSCEEKDNSTSEKQLESFLASLTQADGVVIRGALPLPTTPLKQPCNGFASEGIQHLEHFTVCIPDHGPAKQLYFDVLGFAPDARHAQNIEKGSGKIWANLGTTQIHLEQGKPQVIPGTIGLVYSDLTGVISRLREANRDALEGTAFAWKKESDDLVHVSCPYGNSFRLHKRKPAPPAAGGRSLDPFDARGGSLPFASPAVGTHGLAIGYLQFRVRPGTSAGIARFYREVFDTEAEEVNVSTGSGQKTCLLGYGVNDNTQVAGTVVRAGPVQQLEFMEELAPLPEYDGHHICVYLTVEGFRRSFLAANKMGLIYVNPLPNAGRAITLECAFEEHQFRIQDMVDPVTGEHLHELEHEVRCVTHPAYPVGRDVSASA